MGSCNCPMFCCALLYVHSSFAIIMIGKKELIELPSLSSWCLVIVVRLFLAVSWVCMQFMIAVFPRSYSFTISENMHTKNKEFCTILAYHLKAIN